MIMNLLAIVFVGIIAWIWLYRGFFSSLLNMVCVIIAGEFAFAFWEPISLMILEHAPKQGFLRFIGGAAWGLGLALPFAVSLAVLRLATDSIIRSNAAPDDTSSAVGGAACGVVSGVIATGILVLAAQCLQLPVKFMGYQPLDWASNGSLQRTSKLWVPVDRITARFYQRLSRTTFSSANPLATYYPDLDIVPTSLRMTYGELRLGEARNTMLPEDGQVIGRYTVAGDGSISVPDLLTDAFGTQNATDLDGQPYPPNSHIEGIVFRFNAGAREKRGQVIVMNSQVRLVAVSTAEGAEPKTLFPVAAVSISDAQEEIYARFPFDGREVPIPSRGGQTEVKMGFEFVMPHGYEPLALYVKNIRYDLEGFKPADYPSPGARDRAVVDGSLLIEQIKGTGSLDLSRAVTVKVGDANQSGGATRGQFPDIWVRNSFPFRITLQRGNEGGLSLGAKNRVIDGTGKIAKNRLPQAGLDRALRINAFAVTPDTVVVIVDVSPGARSSLVGRSGQPSDPPLLIDDRGRQYRALGYVYRDRNLVEIRFTPGQPLDGLDDLPGLSRSRDDQNLALVFRPTFNVTIQYFAIGNQVLTEYEGGLLLKTPQN